MAEIVNRENTELSQQQIKHEPMEYMQNLLRNKTRNYSQMTFDDFRKSLGKNEWGVKLFFETLENMNFICKTKEENSYLRYSDNKIRKSKSAYSPCKKSAEKYPELFVYDEDNHIWCLNTSKLGLLDDSFLEEMDKVSSELKEIFDEEKRIKQYLANLKRRREKRKEDRENDN